MGVDRWTKYLLYLIPVSALLLTLYYPGRALLLDIQLEKEGVTTTALCVFHWWKNESEADPEVVVTDYSETAYPKISFVHNDSTYFVDLDPYYYEHPNGKMGYLTTGEKVEIIYFPDNPTRRVVAVNSNAFFWTPLLYLVIFMGVTVALFAWIWYALKD